MKKYELTSETKVVFGHTLHRIRALASFGTVKAGDLGGWIEREDNLSHDGNAWVCDDARVYGNAWVCDDAQVYGNARVYGNAWVCDDAQVYGDAQVCGNARVYGNAWVYGDTWVYGNARVCDDARRKRAAYQKAWREAHRDERAAYQKAYYEAHRDEYAAYQKAYYEAKRDERAAYQKAHYEAHRERLAPQRKIRDARKLRGMSQAALGKLIGVARSTVAHWETCMVPANWTALLEVMPELEGAMRLSQEKKIAPSGVNTESGKTGRMANKITR